MQSSLDDVLPGLMVRGLSLGFLFIPLTTASLSELAPQEMGAGSGIINLTRQLGGSIGIAVLSTLFTRRESFHHDALISRLGLENPALTTWLRHGQAMLEQRGMDAFSAHAAATSNLAAIVEQQASVLSFNDVFLMMVATISLMLPLISYMRRPGAGQTPPLSH